MFCEHDSRGLGVGSLSVVALVVLANAGCTWGRVTDAATTTSGNPLTEFTGTPITGASVVFESLDVDPSQAVTNEATPVVLRSSASAHTWSNSAGEATHPPEVNGYYWINPYAPQLTGVGPTPVAGGWDRVKVSAQGYDTAYFYRNHQYTDAEVQTDTPISASIYPVPPTFDLATSVNGSPTA